ncbi:hypothetical protein HYFRA_00006449 [Hymenoscyphus fraxineus]|uniref:Uncharacterized protein n=1 Tax=Hymenoscyphus fraxineus TaxID=746836 RepID=A0A9N9PPH4_9HELO|nr:hypothetical protein HYFRA_00006449 [Hymenoscyphus fraxineus]
MQRADGTVDVRGVSRPARTRLDGGARRPAKLDEEHRGIRRPEGGDGGGWRFYASNVQSGVGLRVQADRARS